MSAFLKLDWGRFGASGSTIFDSSGKARMYSTYNILRLSETGNVRKHYYYVRNSSFVGDLFNVGGLRERK